MDTFSLLLSFLSLFLFFSPNATANESVSSTQNHEQVIGVIGAILDQTSRIGIEAKMAMEIAVEDVYEKMNLTFDLRIVANSQNDPIQAAFAAKDLMDTQKVQAIVGPQTWEEAALVADIGSKAHTPVLSLAAASPRWASGRWPFLVEAARNPYKQMKAMAAIIHSWEWHQVTVVYEDTVSSTAGVAMPRLYDALREAGIEITNFVAIPPFTSPSLTEELEMIKSGQCRVILVDLSFPLATQLFENAKKMEMMEEDYVWITTDAFTSLVHSINASSISSMEGIIGVGSYFPRDEPNFQDFHKRFRTRFSLEYPEEDNHEPGIHAVQAYDAVRTVCQAMIKTDEAWGQKLLDTILLSKFNGLSGEIEFTDKKLAPSNIFQIINVVGMSYRRLGFWSDDRLGFSRTIDEKATFTPSMNSLKRVNWPGDEPSTPRGWYVQSKARRLRIAVPNGTTFEELLKVVPIKPEGKDYVFGGYVIDLFRAIVDRLPYDLNYDFVPEDGNYDKLVEQVHQKDFDAVVGDVAILSHRLEYVEFSHPYTEPGMVMVVPVRTKACNKAWLFMKPFTKAMWGLTVAITVYNGFVVWLIERNHCSELRGPALNQLTTLIWLSFSTLFSLHGEKLHSNLSRIAMVVWLFVALVITQTYTANLTSILTVPRLEPSVTNIESLQRSNAMVGYCRGSYLQRYLVNVLNFNPNNVKSYNSSEQYAQGLRSKEIAAAFLDLPIAKIFLSKYCKEFTITGTTYKIGGFGFVFPKGSPLVPDINRALLNVSECGTLRHLENNMLASQNCELEVETEEISSISITSYWVLFALTGATSTIALAVYAVHCYSKLELSTSKQKINWRLMSALIAHFGQRNKWFCRKVSDVELVTDVP